MIRILSMLLASLASYLVIDKLQPYAGLSMRAFIGLIAFVIVFIYTDRYLKNLRD